MVMMMVVTFTFLSCIFVGISIQCTHTATSGVIIQFVRRSGKSQITSVIYLLLHALSN